MKSIIYAVAVAAAVLAAPTMSFAQSTTAPLTRAEVRDQLVQLEKAGYNPNDWINYPQNIQAAERTVQAEHAAEQTASNGVPAAATAQLQPTSYGPVAEGTSQSGYRADPSIPVFRGH
jgi:hypothetical protein